jgi:hypothetical protein
MKKLFILLLLIPIGVSAQVSFSPTIEGSISNGLRWVVGTELEVPNLSVSGGWSRLVFNDVQTDGFMLGMTGYLRAFYNSPFLEFKILTCGKADLSEVTGEAKRTMSLVVGYRIYPFSGAQCGYNLAKRCSFNIGTGVEVNESFHFFPRIEFIAKFTIIKVN